MADDKLYGTFGLRGDYVESEVRDLRPNAPVPVAETTFDRATYHAGVVWHAVPNRVAAYLNRSTAIQPVRRVDTRTGRIISNEGTSGFEAGLRYASVDGRLALTWAAYRLWNEGITRNNPRYNDPLLDPDGRQPQFVSSGEEQFTGTEFGLRKRFDGGWSLSARAAWVDAVTTSSPDLPEEVGRQLPRLPRLTASTNLGYSFESEGLKGLRISAAWAWIGEHVAVYESIRRNWEQLEYGSYGVLNLSAAFGWTREKRRHTLSLALRNLLDKDLVAAAGRVGGEFAVDTGYSLRF
jgi:iron complex outermembrane receptor protein